MTAAVEAIGLRDRKKLKQRNDLLETAAKLFRENGFDQTRFEDIASAVTVSAQTVYNYFPTKLHFLLAIQEKERANVIEAYQQVVTSVGNDATDAIARLVVANLGKVRSTDDRKLWRELMAAKLRAPEEERSAVDSGHEIGVAYTEELLRTLRDRGQINRRVPVRLAADIIYALSAFHFRQFCVDHRVTADDVFKAAQEQVRTLLSDWVNP
jgi:AcrR family transcriptional regulator